MCYMAAGSRQVGVRDLRQNLSVHLRRVIAGETLEVTDRGHPVAILAPLPQPATALERLIARGATRPVGDLLDLGPPVGRRSRRASRALQELQEDRL
jgi:antitoxin (DNA-binding transcriptional repressor) of toxin-antitoxin stability system